METKQAIVTLEGKLRELRMQYDQFFKGETRRAPFSERQKMQRALDKLVRLPTTNTQLKFKVQQLSNQFQSLCRYWDRIMLQIENGSYRPDRFKADLHQTSRKSTPPPAAAGEPAKRPAAGDGDLRKLYDQFIEARRVTGENTALGFDSFKKSIEKQKPALEKKYGRKVKFKITVEQGKAKVKSQAD